MGPQVIHGGKGVGGGDGTRLRGGGKAEEAFISVDRRGN